MGRTSIEWASHTWNPVSGCTKVSQGCKNCYAERLVQRFGREGQAVDSDGRVHHPMRHPKFTQIVLHPERLLEPIRWHKPRRVFVCSISDLFHEDVPESFIEAVLNACDRAADLHGHTFMVLTKRPQRMRKVVDRWWERMKLRGIEPRMDRIWFGVSVEDQAAAESRIPALLATPAAVRFISAEPMLGPVSLLEWLPIRPVTYPIRYLRQDDAPAAPIHWIICGGESGPAARPTHPDWVRDLHAQACAAQIPFFFKQWGEWLPSSQVRLTSQAYQCSRRCTMGPNGDPNRLERSEAVPGRNGVEVFYRLGRARAGRALDGNLYAYRPEGGGKEWDARS